MLFTPRTFRIIETDKTEKMFIETARKTPAEEDACGNIIVRY